MYTIVYIIIKNILNNIIRKTLLTPYLQKHQGITINANKKEYRAPNIITITNNVKQYIVILYRRLNNILSFKIANKVKKFNQYAKKLGLTLLSQCNFGYNKMIYKHTPI
jgi:hypothetical protein